MLCLSSLQVDVLQLGRDERMAFFINLYNSLVLHATAVLGPPGEGDH